MFQKHKWPTFSGIIVIIIMVISLFSFVYKFCYRIYMLKKLFFDAFFSEDKITGAMVKVI